MKRGHAPRERVSWNMERIRSLERNERHAPRERVSWNGLRNGDKVTIEVTLHVSVWVEITSLQDGSISDSVTLHVSVWVEIISTFNCLNVLRSRSTWACELKLIVFPSTLNSASHAPRERVSWNTQNLTTLEAKWSHAPRERVSWNCMTTSWLTRVVVTLHVSVWVEMRLQVYGVCKIAVTLHVSVWVEIFEYNPEICQL